MTKDEVKSLVNSVNMVKNMVESIVAAVQDRFKDYDSVVVSLKERIQRLEDYMAGTSQTGSQVMPTDSSDQISKLEKRLDSLNERILLIEAARSVHKEAVVEPTEVQALKDVTVQETKPIIPSMPPAPAAPPPTPETAFQESMPESVPVQEAKSGPPSVEAPSIPTPTPPTPVRITETEPLETEPQPTAEVPSVPTPAPTPAAIPKPATQPTETVERDVSPISREVTGSIPAPPTQVDTSAEAQEIQPQVPKTEDVTAPEEKKSAEVFGEAVSGDKAELLKALKKLEDL